jgi:sulfatase maturation enzyme AslB (radical SAM superfamily)
MDNCLDAFKNLNIAEYNGSILVSPCCISQPVKSKTVDHKNIQYLKNIRNSWSQGISPAPCGACKLAESSGVNSRRLGANQWYKDNGYDNSDVELIRLDYWVGDTCNLRCAICLPEYSSAWKQELGVSPKLKKSVVNHFWRNLDLSTLRSVHFNGGEPLLSKTHVEFLQALPNKDQIHINYNTNATILPDQLLLDLWQKFKLVQIDFSIDDIEKRFEYQRYPANWKHVTNNLQWYIDHAPHNCMFAVNTTVGILNHANLNSLNLWVTNNFYVSRFSDPIEHRQQLAGGLFALDGVEKRTKQIKRFLDSCDARRGTNWQTTFTELTWINND